MKKFLKITAFFCTLILAASLLTACGSADAKNSAGREMYGLTEDDSGEIAEKSASTAKNLAQNRKIIEYVDVTVETKTFDKLLDDIQKTVEASGGYTESSDVQGNGYYGDGTRTAQLKVRIPNTEKEAFSDFLRDNGNVISRSVNTDDVTDQYIDTESRIKALTLEKETLEKLITESANVSDTLTVYEKLTDVIAELESYRGKRDKMDNLIEFTTFTVRIEEVEKETPVERQNWFVKTWDAFTENLSDIGTGFSEFFSFLLAALPYWVLLAAVGFIGFRIVRRIRKKKKQGQN